jgi:hypothetical protein
VIGLVAKYFAIVSTVITGVSTAFLSKFLYKSVRGRKNRWEWDVRKAIPQPTRTWP